MGFVTVTLVVRRDTDEYEVEIGGLDESMYGQVKSELGAGIYETFHLGLYSATWRIPQEILSKSGHSCGMRFMPGYLNVFLNSGYRVQYFKSHPSEESDDLYIWGLSNK